MAHGTVWTITSLSWLVMAKNRMYATITRWILPKPRAYQWLLNHKLLGPYIRDFRESRAIPLRAKILALSLLWLTSLHCIFLMFDALWLKAMMLAVAVGVTLYLCSLKTKRND